MKGQTLKHLVRWICCLMTLATGTSAAGDPRPRIYLEQVSEGSGKRWFAGTMRDDRECIETAIDLNSWIMRKAGETGIHYACKVELPYPMPAVDTLVRLMVRTWTVNGEEKVQFVGNLTPVYCSSTLEAKTEAYQRARFPLRFKFECIGNA